MNPGARTFALPLVGLASALATSGGCQEPTQITLEISTDASCAEVVGTTISSQGSGQSERKLASTEHCEGGRVGSLVLVPSERGGPVTVSVVQGVNKSPDDCVKDGDAGGCIVARRVVSFVEHSSLRLPVNLEASCLGVACSPTDTCQAGVCVPLACAGSQTCGDGGTTPDAPACPSGSGDCNQSASDGCETDLTADPMNCTACANVCPAPSVANADPACAAAGCTATCKAGFADCDSNMSNGCEAELARDYENCGKCGNDCKGGGCNAGACHAPPVVLDSADGYTGGIAISGSYAYWGLMGLRRVPVAGGAATVLEAGTNGNFARSVAVDGSQAFYSTLSTLRSIPAGGGSATVLASVFACMNVAADASTLYFLEGANNNNGAVRKLAKTGGTPTTLATSQLNPAHIAMDGANVYWANRGTYPAYPGDGAIMRVSKSGGTPTTLASGQKYARGLAVASGAVVWATSDTIFKVPIGGGSTQTLATDVGISALTADGTTVYFGSGTSTTGHRLRAVSASGGPVSDIAVLPQYVAAIAVGSGTIYFTYNTDTLLKVPK